VPQEHPLARHGVIETLLRRCSDVRGVARLFVELGYPVCVRRVGREPLIELGLTRPFPRLVHLTRHGGVDLYVARARSDQESESVREIERLLAERNHVIKPVIVELGVRGSNRLAIHARVGRSRRRLDVDTAHPSADLVDRIRGLSLREHIDGDPDPAVLFERALDREAMARRFFDQFRRAVARVADGLGAACQSERAPDCREQALLLLSRVLFVYLIQRKGWLDGDHRFLRERLSQCVRRGRNFHETILHPLFFDCLNKPRARRSRAAGRLGRIPYLNGGLFEPSSFEKRHASIELENDMWEEVLDSAFEPFTLSVSEVDEEGAHIDPEMLGKVFEGLMEGSERARTGSFYTPRPVVDRLTESAIVRWCGRGDEELTTRLRALLRGERTAIDAGIASTLLRRLEGISVLDPACGSGAFLLAALRTIESLTRSLMAIAGQVPPPDLRSRIAASALHGVDLKMEAVRLCELRIWLAIVSASDLDADSVPPLPNLDRNILQGNSLLGPFDFLAEGRRELYRDWVQGLRHRKRLLDEYRHSSSTRRRTLGSKLRESDESLARALLTRSVELDSAELKALGEPERGLFDGAPELSAGASEEIEARLDSACLLLERLERREISFFSFELHYANILARGGFSVVLGNPPWVRGSNVEPALRRLLADRYRSFSNRESSGIRQAEMAMAFVERALALTEAGGVVAQLVPSKVTSAEYARPIRRALMSEASIVEMHDWSAEGKRLFDADVFPFGIVAAKTEVDNALEFRSVGEHYPIARHELSVGEPGSPWATMPPDVRAIVRLLNDRFPSFEEGLGRRPIMGVKTGANAKFFLDRVEIGRNGVVVPALGLELPPGAVVRTVRGRDLTRWRADDTTWMLWPPALNGDHRVREKLAASIGVTPAALRLSYVKSEHLGLKVAWKDVSRGLDSAVLPDHVLLDGHSFSVVPNQTLYSIDVPTREEGLALACLLNSSVANALALVTAERAKDHHWRYMANVVGTMASPRIGPENEFFRTMVKLARRAEQGDENQGEIDQVVARAYGLEPHELRVLEVFVARRLGRADGNG
jgi:hypothetical protein